MRFVKAFIAFVGLIVPGTFAMALLAAPPAKPAPIQQPGCLHDMAAAGARVTASKARIQGLGAVGSAQLCKQTLLYFLEVVKARAVTARCDLEPNRDRVLGRFDADVLQINERIAVACN